MKKTGRFSAMHVCLLAMICALSIAEAQQQEAEQILSATGIGGGLVAHIGCGDGKLTAALHINDRYLVHGLDVDADNVDKAREHIRSLGIYGVVSVEQLAGDRLPYTDNLVNLVVTEQPGGISMDEVMRVLAPDGVAYIKKEGKWRKMVKPRPEEMDEWTHYLHDATGNAVAKDMLVGPPKCMQWVAKPLYGRSHEVDTTVSALVSANGRIFFILDEGLTGITDERLPQKWVLVARDAFNGVLLWKRPLPDWGWVQWKKEDLAGKDWTGLRGQRTRSPGVIPRRLVADGDRVYITLGYSAPVTALDAATGKMVRSYEGTGETEEILYSEGILALCIRKRSAGEAKRRGEAVPESILAVKAETGDVLWEKQEESIMPLSPAIGESRLFFHNNKEIVCLDLRTGEELWRSASEAPKGNQWSAAATLVAHNGVVLLTSPKELVALSAETGETLWTGPGGKGPGVANPPDLFVAGGLVWSGKSTDGYDLMTGEVKRSIDLQNLITQGHHFRCYRSKATERYLLWPKRGVEFIDLESEDHMRHDWLRAPCKLGFMPSNGLLYMPPHQCFCYPTVKINGFNALAAARGSNVEEPRSGERLERGPAYGQIGNLESTTQNPGDWPTYRHDPKRSGSIALAVPSSVKKFWQVELGGKITQPVVAGGKLLVALADTHRVLCLDAGSGKLLWSHIAGGRVDSPPTAYKGLVLFGSADGWVYCLRSTDGELVWRFRAAPEDRRVVAFGQLESAWPVHGSVLVKDDVAYFAAGRSSYLDGGIYLYGLDPITGNLMHEARLDGPHPDIANDPGRPFDMEGAMSDVLVTDGTFLYMHQTMFDSSLAEKEAPRATKMGDRKVGRHIFSTAGFLDDSWWNRTFWMYSERWPGYYIANQAPKAGQLLVFDDTSTYGVKCYTRRNRHSPMFFPDTDGYLLFADDNDNEPVLVDKTGNPKPVKWLPDVNEAIGHKLDGTAVDKDKGTGFTRIQPPKWAVWVPVRIRAMVLADETLFVAGPPDVLDPDDPLAAFEGRKGAMLWAVSSADGKKLAEYKLDSPPVFDGMIAADGKLYLSMQDGKLLCFGEGI